jgi:hypothetical protein
MAARLGYSEELLGLSLRALVRPLRMAGEFARSIRPQHQLIGVITPGNIPGAGLHEIAAALIAGGAVIVKTSVAEPVFFAQMAATLRDLDLRFGTGLGARFEVFNWRRGRADLTRAMFETCDRIVALGDDATIDELVAYGGAAAAQTKLSAVRQEREPHQFLFAFGARSSGVALMREALFGERLTKMAKVVALDCALFDQRGCLSPHHIFVEGPAREFAAQLAMSFRKLVKSIGGEPRWIGLEDAAAIRRVREAARWRALGGDDVELWEDRSFDWTVVFDRNAGFTRSPGFRTVYVSAFNDLPDLEQRLESVAGKLEGFGLAGEESRVKAARIMVERIGATYVCEPGNIQSPPLDWRHGGGDFIRLMLA